VSLGITGASRPWNSRFPVASSASPLSISSRNR
jgi:hypothetical protein